MTSVSASKRGGGQVQSWTDADLAPVLSAAKEGEGLAFEQLYRWMAPQVANFAAARGADDAEGIANEVFLRVFRQIGNFEGESTAFRSWIFAITRNLVIDGHRARSRRPQVSSQDVPERLVDGAETEAMESLANERVSRMLDLLSDDQRDVILLRMIADLSLQQVAVVVDKPVTAVKALQRRGLRRLQDGILTGVALP